MPIVGIDFDNTMVCYDSVFYDAARDRDLIPADLSANKESIRDHLRETEREELWTELQAFVYGKHIQQAEPFPGLSDFLICCANQGISVAIISHKTQTPYRGPAFDLRAAATAWLESRGFIAPSVHGVPRDQVFFEETKLAKLVRIRSCRCDAFIDDLPEFLTDPGFPSTVRRIHFDPADRGCADSEVLSCRSWSEVSRNVLRWFTP